MLGLGAAHGEAVAGQVGRGLVAIAIEAQDAVQLLGPARAGARAAGAGGRANPGSPPLKRAPHAPRSAGTDAEGSRPAHNQAWRPLKAREMASRTTPASFWEPRALGGGQTCVPDTVYRET
jgi:hypothetical protein